LSIKKYLNSEEDRSKNYKSVKKRNNKLKYEFPRSGGEGLEIKISASERQRIHRIGGE